MHNIVHPVLGTAWPVASVGERYARIADIAIGAGLLVVFVLGDSGREAQFLNIDRTAEPDNYVHLVYGGLSLSFGLRVLTGEGEYWSWPDHPGACWRDKWHGSIVHTAIPFLASVIVASLLWRRIRRPLGNGTGSRPPGPAVETPGSRCGYRAADCRLPSGPASPRTCCAPRRS